MEELPAGIGEVLAEHGTHAGEIRLSPIPGGASRETWLAEAGEQRWVLRRDHEGSVSLVPIRDEFALLDLAHEAGVPVPRPIVFEPPGGRFGPAGMLMSFVEGTSVAPRILRKPEFETARGNLTGQLAQALAGIHAIDPVRLDGM